MSPSVVKERAWVLALLIAFALGALTSFGQAYGPASVEPLFNSATSWCVIAFVLSFAARGPLRAAILGATSLAMLLAGYYVTSDIRGYPVSASSVAMWAAAALALGPLLGVGSAWIRSTPTGPRDVRRGLAVAPLGGIAIGEGLYGVLVISDTTPGAYWWTQVVLGVAFVAVALLLRTNRLRVRAIGAAATLGMAAAALVALRSR